MIAATTVRGTVVAREFSGLIAAVFQIGANRVD
jgi:hypothetical protein